MPQFSRSEVHLSNAAKRTRSNGEHTSPHWSKFQIPLNDYGTTKLQIYCRRPRFKNVSPKIERAEADLLMATKIEAIGGGMCQHVSIKVSACDPRAPCASI